jgi:membrane fusion protein (multidrug efflux system)
LDQGIAKSGETEQESAQNDKPDGARRKLRLAIAGAVVLVVGVVGLLWWLHARHYENTDDAYIDGDITNVAPRAAGQVTEVRVVDNQWVRAGELLVQVDDSIARTQLAAGAAARAQALSHIDEAKAQVEVAEAQLAQSQANTRAPAAQAAADKRNYARYLSVRTATPAAVAPQQLDQSQTTFEMSAAQLVAAEKQVHISQAQLVSARTQLGTGQAELDAAEAQIAQARLQITYGRVVASIAGHVSHKTVAVGDFVQTGQQLMSIVPDVVWITANFKETQLTGMRPGQPVEIHIDAYPDLKVTGHVDSIQWGAGQSFALLPAQNATGNFVKVVQRVPVKILIDQPQRIRQALGPGMSVEPHVKVD